MPNQVDQKRSSYTWSFRIVVTSPKSGDPPGGNFHLLGDSPDHVTPMNVINGWVGKKVLALRGDKAGVSLVITDMDTWSDYVSAHVDEEGGVLDRFRFTLPDAPPINRRHS